jgi:hypothetical protein
VREIYLPLYLNPAPLLFTGRGTAELIKYCERLSVSVV